MTKGIAAFLTIRQSDFNTVVAKYQSYWPGMTVAGHVFKPFTAGAITSNSSGGQQSFSLEFGLQAATEQIIEVSAANGYIYDCELKEFTPTATGVPPATLTTFARFLGELLSASKTDQSITVEVGTSLDPVKAQAPPRKFTTALVGDPPQL
jgi:hypothetical protein